MSKAITDEFREVTLDIRGVKYQLKELSASAYDDIVKVAAGPDDSADMNTVLKMMLAKSLIDPHLDSAQLGAKPFPVLNRLLQEVNRMHFSVEPDATPAEPGPDGEPAPPNT